MQLQYCYSNILLTFALVMKQFLSIFQKHKQQLGIASVLLGIVMLTIGYCFAITSHNWYTLLCLLLIIGGTVAHVIILKRESKY